MHAREAEQTPLDAQLEGRLRQLSSGAPDLKYLLEGEATETAPVSGLRCPAASPGDKGFAGRDQLDCKDR